MSKFEKVLLITLLLCSLTLYQGACDPVRARRNVNHCSPDMIRKMKNMGVDVSKSNIDCKNKGVQPKRDAQKVDINKRPYGPHDGQYCCSPDCDFLYAVIDVHPSVVKCYES